MPEHDDPTRLLESFGTGGITTTPLDPARVRQLGDRRRARRRAAYVAASAAVVVAAIVPVAVLNGRDDAAPPITHHSGGPTPTPSATPSATASASATPPQVTTYPGAGVQVVTAADTARLTGTTDAFKAFIASQAEKAASDGASCPGAFHGITVHKYSSAGYAIGGFNACGGYAALWVIHQNAWQEGDTTQDTWDCATLHYFGVPRSFAGDCFDYTGDFGPTKVDGLRLGMSAAEITAAGGTVGPGPASSCRTVFLPQEDATTGDGAGVLSPTKGLVGIHARPGMKTPEKIGLGSTLAQIRAAYPAATQGIDGWFLPLPNGTEYQFLVDQHGMLYELWFETRVQDCFG